MEIVSSSVELDNLAKEISRALAFSLREDRLLLELFKEASALIARVHDEKSRLLTISFVNPSLTIELTKLIRSETRLLKAMTLAIKGSNASDH